MNLEHWVFLTGLVREKRPLIHCITNYVTAGDVANAILACGGSPVMADHPDEVKEVTGISNCLLLNTGTPKEHSKAAMENAGLEANRRNLPVILDPVGIGISAYRTDLILEILKKVKTTVIRGNASELRILLNVLTGLAAKSNPLPTHGVDVCPEDQITGDNVTPLMETAKALSALTGAVTVITGTIDIVSTQKETRLIKNGCMEMSQITGSGCMLDGVIASYAAAAYDFTPLSTSQNGLLEAVSLATAVYGLCGERAARKTNESQGGTGSFHRFFMDEISCFRESDLKGGLNIEIS